MRQLTSVESSRIKALTENSVEITLIEPTRNGLKKSIMDATGPVRTYLKEKGVHDFSTQKQGPENKALINTLFINSGSLTSSVASLYRPITKKGDPRIWFKQLGSYAQPNDIIAILFYDNKLLALNITQIDVTRLIKSTITNPLKELVIEIKEQSNAIANELLKLLRNISRSGLVKATVNADTAVGRSLEQALGIKINSSRQPDYKGIELKSFRSGKNNRKNLFAQVPNWELSKFKSSAEILDNFGYKRDDDYKLYCTVSTLVSNAQGLRLKIDTELGHLIENSNKKDIGDFVVWALETLHSRLLEKHNETFWIAAETKIIDGEEYFQYNKVQHTRKPIVSQFDVLLEQGLITLDHLIKKSAKGKVVEKGPLFKIKPESIGLLFPPSQLYNL